MTYMVKEIYCTLQGEGANTGRQAVFCRFAGCNLWSGREEDHHKAICQFCDTDFSGIDGPGGGKFSTAQDLANAILAKWHTRGVAQKVESDPERVMLSLSKHVERLNVDSSFDKLDMTSLRLFGQPIHAGRPGNGSTNKFVVCTGGEPLLQMDEALLNALHSCRFEIAIETNGTLLPPRGIDWICVSPKADADFVLRKGDELKVVYPQERLDPRDFENLDFDNFFIQPMDGPDIERNTKLAMRFCLENPKWRLSLQTHKLLNIP